MHVLRSREWFLELCSHVYRRTGCDLPIDGVPANHTDGDVVGRQETISASDTVAEATIP